MYTQLGRVSFLAKKREKRGEKSWNGCIYEAVVLVTLGKSRQFPPSLISAVNDLTNVSTYPSAFPRLNGGCASLRDRREMDIGEREFGCKLETSVPP